MNGYEFVVKVLGETNNDVGPLIELANKLETDWIEFKAATKPEDGHYTNKENKWDYSWHVAKACFSLANTIGGAVLLGISEIKDHPNPIEPVNLKFSGFDGDHDKFMQSLQTGLLYPENGWRGVKHHWRCLEDHRLFRAIWGRYQDQDIVIVLVRPRQKTDGWISLEHSDSGKDPETVILSRRPGHVGETVKTAPQGETHASWWETREVDRPDLDKLWISFRDSWTKERRHADNVVDRSIENYLAKQQKYLTNRESWISEKNSASPDNRSMPDLEVKAVSESAETQRGTFRGLVRREPKVLLLGEPGAGKTTALRALAMSKATSWHAGQSWVLLVSLAEYDGQGLRALLLQHFPDLWWIDLQPRLDRREILLLLDGLNECAGLFYDDCIQEIKVLLKDHPNAKILVSSRLTHQPADLELPAYVISPMTRQVQEQFLQFHLHDPERVTELLVSIYSQPGAELIAGSPVLLQMMAEIFRSGGDLPQSRANLYQQSFAHWHRRELEKPGVSFRWSESRTRNALARLSFQMREAGQISCSRNEARRILEPELGDDVGRFLDRVAQGLLLIVEKSQKDESVRFSHETMQEYLAAEYLVANERDLPDTFFKSGLDRISTNWTIPFVFAFELNTDPTREFLHQAWRLDPLLVAAALRDSNRLTALPLRDVENLWTRGVLRAMRGDENVPETKDLALVSRLPPKYPLPNTLVAALRGLGFWYAGGSHEAGKDRIERLRRLILDRNSLWIELLPHAYASNPGWLDEMSPAQRVLIGEPMRCTERELLAESTVIELCALHRRRKIGDQQFWASWEAALRRYDGTHLDTDLPVLLRTMAKVKADRTTKRDWAENFVSKLTDVEQNSLRQIWKSWLCSYRLLNLLVRLRLVDSSNIREDPGRLSDIIAKTSPDNAFRFMKNGVLTRDDLPSATFAELLQQWKPDYKRELLEMGCIREGDIRLSTHERRYSAQDINDAEERKAVSAQLVLKEWQVTVKSLHKDGAFGFAKHPEFAEDLYFYVDRIEDEYSRPIAKGDILLVTIQPAFDRKRSRWSFAVHSGKLLQKCQRPAIEYSH